MRHEEDLNYQSFSSDNEPNFRGFTTSINAMFVDPDQERVDCCSMACCGSLQADRNRYIVTGVKPPSCMRRFILHIIFPFWIFSVATYCALSINEHWLNELFSSGFIVLLFCYFVLQCFKGSFKRKLVRKELLWSKYELLTTGTFRLRHYDEDSTVESIDEQRLMRQPPEYFMGQTMSDIRNAHGLFGCYRNDFPEDCRSIESDDVHICRKFFKWFSNACCGVLCCRQLQMCGVCALAQEGRELEAVIHPAYRRIDYITMQPMLDYYPAIYEQRCTGESSLSWWGRLSQFSQDLVRTSIVVLVALLGWSLLAERINHHFYPKNYVVVVATLLQAFVLMGIVYRKHKNDVSIDALIKFAASGFCLSTTLAVFFELVIGLTIRLVMSIVFDLSGISLVQSNSYSMTNGSSGFGDLWGAMQEASGGSSYRDYLHVYGREHPIFYTFYLLFKSFVLAALVEELCKYYAFKMVEHPDFLSQRELEEAAKYTYDEEESQESKRKSTSFPLHDRGAKSRGAAITVSMVAASLGFTCCENLVYIFVYGEATIGAQIFILVLRSLLPVHPVAAAIQSIRVCERELEGKKIGLGSVVLPGVLFHGAYDFVLMWIDFLGHRNGNYLAEEDDDLEEAADWSDQIALGMGFIIVILGWVYYVRESRKQALRLQEIDKQSSRTQSRLL
jgi:RsiW-degrading membrane proteinase PrsW (M82 family)